MVWTPCLSSCFLIVALLQKATICLRYVRQRADSAVYPAHSSLSALQVYPGSLSAPLLLAFVVRQLHRLGLVSDRHRLSRAVAERYSEFLTQVTELGGAHERIVAAVRTLADRDRHEVT